MTDLFKHTLTGQFEASLAMLTGCIEKCPPEHWDDKIAKYPFWMVAYHTLCFVDVYLSPRDEDWRPIQDAAAPGGGLHPKGRAELDEEYPSRRFERGELLEYTAICRRKLAGAIAAETEATLRGPSGFAHLPFSRAELHLYNIRHVQHHTGQLSAALRRVGVDTGRWVKTGWK